MSSRISVRESEKRERRREINARIDEFRWKYGMNFEEFFDAAEDMRKYGELIKREFDSG